jgi:hypothetical protein
LQITAGDDDSDAGQVTKKSKTPVRRAPGAAADKLALRPAVVLESLASSSSPPPAHQPSLRIRTLTSALGVDIGRPSLVDPGARIDPFDAPVPVPEFNVRVQRRALRRLEQQQGKKKKDEPQQSSPASKVAGGGRAGREGLRSSIPETGKP